MKDLIDRQAALDAIKKLEKPAPTAQHLSAIFDCEDTIKALPSAQPTGTNTVQVEDTISRQAAIDIVVFECGEWIGLAKEISKQLKQLPSAQPGCEDAVPWEQLERYAKCFCAQVSYPEFVREAKAFCKSTIAAMKGGNIAPSVTPKQPGWIPCSERLPEDYTDVLVWFEYYRYGDYNRLYQMHGIGSYMSEYDSWMINHETGWRKLRVFAWMPLPEPWKGGPDGTAEKTEETV